MVGVEMPEDQLSSFPMGDGRAEKGVVLKIGDLVSRGVIEIVHKCLTSHSQNMWGNSP
jgi:hypothetical protein